MLIATSEDYPMSATARTPHGEIAYRELGEGAPIVFVHGLLVDGRLWSGVAEQLAAGHRCIVPDWPVGSHRIAMNEDADLTPPGLAQIIASFMEAVGLERATIVGNDTGGAISQLLAANHPQRVERLVLTNCDMFDHFPPFPFNGLPLLARLPGGVTALQLPNRLAFVRRMGFAPLVCKPLAQELIDSWLEPAASDKAIKRDLTKVLRGIHKRHTLAAAEGLRSFERPIRFAWGADDRLFKRADAERLAAMAPDVRIVDIADARTFVPLDQPERVAELVGEFATEETSAGV
jgi:pimeloyl-ACP methyl ester carboxylesterase